MQVVTSATPVVREAYERAGFSQSVAKLTTGTDDSPFKTAGAAMSYIAASTRLSGAEKTGFIRLLQDISESGLDPRLIAGVMAIAQLMESSREEGTYQRETLEKYVGTTTGRDELKRQADAALDAQFDLLA